MTYEYPIDYRRTGTRLVCRIMAENNRRLSRTHQGESNTGVSLDKVPLLLVGNALREQVQKNELEVCRFVHAQNGMAPPRSGDDIRELLTAIADKTNDSLLPDGRYRTWQIAADQPSITGGPAVSGSERRVAPEKIHEALAKFCSEVWQRWSDLLSDPVPLAARAEWQLGGGPLHPFYDGCGRISRAFAAMLLVRESSLLPLFVESSQYFNEGNQGVESFLFYYRSRIEASQEWLRGENVL